MTSAGELFEKHHLAIFRFLHRMLGRKELAEDLTQEVYLRVVRALATYREQRQERAWLFRIARNVLADRHRSESRAAETPEFAVMATAASPPTLTITLDQALARVPEHERTAFLLREVGGLGYLEIAKVTDTTPDAVRNRIHRARLSLRRVLADPPAGSRPRPAKEMAS
jgi:RNA polymerase sigma-70 factor (ECF subfamily)